MIPLLPLPSFDKVVSKAWRMLTSNPAADDLGRDDEFERSLYYFAFGTKDKVEGTSAFLEKRAPKWS